jgi:peptidyl-prolyl cis-trans isomerase D
LRKGEDIKTLTETLSKDETAAGGELIFVKGKMDKTFEDTAFSKLKPGETSGIIKTNMGFTVIKLEEKIPEGKPVSYRAAREYHEFNLGKGTLIDARYQTILDGWLKTYEINTNKSVYESIK